jgi:hypothetical protein
MKQFLSFTFLLILFQTNPIYSQETITLDAAATMDPNTHLMQGFLHGGSADLDSVKLAKLTPQFWRIGAYWVAGSGYHETKRFNPKITVNVNDLYMIVNEIPSQTLSQPWVDDWFGWDSLLTAIAHNSIDNDEPVDYWDLWGEPDNFWTGTYSDWIEMYRRSDSILSEIIPSSKIIGPEFGFGACDFSVGAIMNFLDSLYLVDAAVDGVSWHEFCQPEDAFLHGQQVRDSLAVRPWLGDLEIMIPEYAGPSNHIIPGWNVGWLYYFEKSDLDWVSHGCWDESNGIISWSDCQFGLNGLFMNDNFTTQPNYWVHRAYAELDSVRLLASTSHAKTVALASKNDEFEEIKILTGRYDNPNLGSHNAPANVVINLTNYPYCFDCTLPYTIQRIPSNDVPHSIPLNSPITTFSGFLTFSGNSATIPLNSFVDGDAYIVYVNPSENSILSMTEQLDNFKIFPNPTNDQLTIVLPTNLPTEFRIYNLMGELIKEFTIETSTQINLNDLASGVYIIQKTNQPLAIQKFVKE